MDQQKKQTFIIWFSGFYEGEGSISNDISNRNKLRISVSQNDPHPLYKAKECWGGNVTKRIRKSPASDKICTGYEWRINHNDSLKFIDDISPYMIIPYKIEQMKKCIDACKIEWNGKYKCNFCDNVYTDRSGARRHELKDHINKGELFTCNICKTEYKSKDSMNRHNRLKHKSEPDASQLKTIGNTPYNDGNTLRALNTTLIEKSI